MRLNEIKARDVTANLNADDLVILHNVMYFYEKHAAEHGEKAPGPKFHDLAIQITTAMNLCQYGILDDFALSLIARHKLACCPDGKLAHALADHDQGRDQAGSAKE